MKRQIQAVIAEIKIASSKWIPICISAYPNDSGRRHCVEALPIQRITDSARIQQEKRYKNLDVPFRTAGPCNGTDRTRSLRSTLSGIRVIALPFKMIRLILNTLVTIAKECRFLAECFVRMKEIDLLLVVGSNQLFDYVEGAWYFPYNILKWSLMAKLRKKTLAIVCVGAGPINASLSKRMIRVSLEIASYRSFRDKSSKATIDAIGAGHIDDAVLPDLAFSLKASNYSGQHKIVPNGKLPAIGFNPMPVWDTRFWPDGNQEKYESLTQRYAQIVEWLLAHANRVVFYATHPKDVLVIEDIVNIVGPSSFLEYENSYPDTVDKLMERLSHLEISVATRFHGILLPYLHKVPVIGIEYWDKTTYLMEYMEQIDYLVPASKMVDNPSEFKLDFVVKKIQMLKQNLQSERQKIESRNALHRTALSNQYRKLWSLAHTQQS